MNTTPMEHTAPRHAHGTGHGTRWALFAAAYFERDLAARELDRAAERLAAADAELARLRAGGK